MKAKEKAIDWLNKREGYLYIVVDEKTEDTWHLKDITLKQAIDIALKEQAKEIIEDILKKSKCRCASVTHNSISNSTKKRIANMIEEKYLRKER